MITASELRAQMSYDPESGAFTWRVGVTTANGGVRIKAGTIAGSKTLDGYVKIKIAKRMYRAHRLAWLYTYGDWPAHQVDHINGNRSDNRIANLRHATNRENRRNAKLQRNNAVGLKGVSACRSKYRARIRIDGNLKALGSFDTPEEAHAAYMTAAKIHFGEFARAS